MSRAEHMEIAAIEAQPSIQEVGNIRRKLGAVLAAGALAVTLAPANAEAAPGEGERVPFTGQGLDNIEVCEEGQAPYIHWVFTAGGAQSEVTGATLFVNQNPTAEFIQKGEGQGAWHAYTEFIDTESSIWVDTDGNTGPGKANIVVSDACISGDQPVEPEPEVPTDPEQPPAEPDPEVPTDPEQPVERSNVEVDATGACVTEETWNLVVTATNVGDTYAEFDFGPHGGPDPDSGEIGVTNNQRVAIIGGLSHDFVREDLPTVAWYELVVNGNEVYTFTSDTLNVNFEECATTTHQEPERDEPEIETVQPAVEDPAPSYDEPRLPETGVGAFALSLLGGTLVAGGSGLHYLARRRKEQEA